MKPGDMVWAIARDEEGYPWDTFGEVLVAIVEGYAICASKLNGCADLAYILNYVYLDCSANDTTSLLSVYPLSDVYATRSEAEEAYTKESGREI